MTLDPLPNHALRASGGPSLKCQRSPSVLNNMPKSIEELVADILRERGYSVARLVEGEEKSPDLFAEKRGERFLVEVKIKQDDSTLSDRASAAFSEGRLFEEHYPMGRRNRVSAIIAHGAEQLTAQAVDDPLRVMWFVALGRRSEVYCSQIEGTLLGTTRLFDLEDTAWQLDCHFFYQSEFFRHRERLDAAVVLDVGKGRLLLNPYSPRASRLRSSPLVETFGSAVLDPAEAEKRGEAVLADCAVD